MRFVGYAMCPDSHGDHRVELVWNNIWVKLDNTISRVK
ncbi:hypothetical protein L494_0055 [Bordetella bronchiseptica CA90 BB1334]|uniref:Uncharacterized protein n=1 Tax=Bordetella bronchiseptica 00-P-2796 TaxID=1331199 RepID=A0ABR4RLK5_BORBO|nr:hypothetical protein L576_0078 [Bordetella bronchiseptica OSU054]KCV38319.1 hypothetical protein L490_5371 [Bordetella bronchiseptica 00-P-2796]KDB74198.1 hypothetical protein L494_0055 [Bordetella bronchiseptica CA90 BB1334]KDC17933.1 hypothetical protein L542_0076 [Bordetella bronchiseptica F-1]KDC24659.1 hypothetical protein L504_0078 [Bordetella bronchiseptica F2]KDD45552.1 hypothetical protein L532_5275 [Bordetella bronchiseptica OSU095]